ncbi:MAG TPA: CRISPR-associated endoribonuclease Cas6 [Archaeoglobus profundus]|nr:CRISPR-associated endoribonuclease Cas6 [Archaeoglobus profundus]
MIVHFTIEFVASESIYFGMYSGAYVRAFLYWVLRKINRILAEELHQSKGLAPFATSPVYKDDNYWLDKVEKDEKYKFNISVFVEDIGEALKDFLMKIDRIHFLGRLNRLEYVEVKYVDNFDDKITRKFKIEFLTPCYFRIPNYCRFVPLPLPQLLFRSLARLYEAYIGELPREYRDWLDKWGIALSGCKIETKKVSLKRGLWSVGFVGEATFSIPDNLFNEDFARITSKLLSFGEYSNVGGGRTSGLGKIRVIKSL